MINRNAPKELRYDYGLLGGVIEFGNSIYFVKAVGNNSLIKANKSNFDEFIYSISLKSVSYTHLTLPTTPYV